MNKHYLAVVLLSLISLASCNNAPTPPKPDVPLDSEGSAKSSTPDPNDLLHTLQGRWQNEQDTNYTLEIADTQMRHLKNGKLSYQSMIDVDGTCESSVCRPDGEDTSDGWCFTEMTVENGKYAAQCNFVIDCDTSRLHYRSLSGSRIELSFKKIQ